MPVLVVAAGVIFMPQPTQQGWYVDNLIVELPAVPSTTVRLKTPVVVPSKPAGTDTKGKVSTDTLQAYLLNLGSPLAAHAEQIAQSEFAATIIGICYIEQYRCTRAPYNNYWGIMSEANLAHYPDLPSGIAAIDGLLQRYYSRGYDNLEEMNCYYVQPCSATWLATVKKVQKELLTLKQNSL